MIRTKRVTVSTTPTLLASAANANVGMPKTVVVQNISGVTLFVGGVTRTGAAPQGGAAYTLATSGSDTGYSIATLTERSFDLGPTDDLYGLVAAATQDVIVLEMQAN